MWKLTNKKKGDIHEQKSADFWIKTLGLNKKDISKTPRSGAIIGMSADLMVRKDCVLQDFVIDVKAEQGLIAKKGLEYYDKNRQDANGKPSFLEIYVEDNFNSPYILISRKDFGRIICELDGYRKEGESNHS